MPTNWWNKFFDLNFGLLLQQKNQQELNQSVNFLIKNLHLKKGDQVFDQCCGTGDLSIALAQKGLTAISYDQSQLYIALAQKKAKDQKVNCLFRVKDCYASAPTNCNAAFNWYTSFGYSDDKTNIKMIKKAYSSIKKGGFFALDFYNLPGLLRSFKPTHIRYVNFNGQNIKVIKKSSFDLTGGRFISNWTYSNKKTAKPSTGSSRCYFPFDLKQMFESTGFKNIRFFGNINGTDLTIDSPRCIIIGQK